MKYYDVGMEQRVKVISGERAGNEGRVRYRLPYAGLIGVDIDKGLRTEHFMPKELEKQS